ASYGLQVSGNRTRDLLFAEIIALVLALSLITWLAYTDSTVYTAEELAGRLGAPVLSIVERAGRLRTAQARLPALFRPEEHTAEAFRQLRLNLQLTSGETPLRSLVVTSTMASEG